MSRSCRYIVKNSSAGRFAVVDTATDSVIHDHFRTHQEALARARGLNEAVSYKPAGYQSVRCPGCNTALLVRPGDKINCPTCARERAAIETRIDWEETRARELEEARRSVEDDIESREFVMCGDRWDGLE